MSRTPRTPTIRHYIDNPFELSEYEGDVNDTRVEFWCKKCDCPAQVEYDELDGEVESIRCPLVGDEHFHVTYELYMHGEGPSLVLGEDEDLLADAIDAFWAMDPASQKFEN